VRILFSLQALEDESVSRADVTAALEGVEPDVKVDVADMIAEVHPLKLVSSLNVFKKVAQGVLIPEGMTDVEAWAQTVAESADMIASDLNILKRQSYNKEWK